MMIVFGHLGSVSKQMSLNTCIFEIFHFYIFVTKKNNSLNKIKFLLHFPNWENTVSCENIFFCQLCLSLLGSADTKPYNFFLTLPNWYVCEKKKKKQNCLLETH